MFANVCYLITGSNLIDVFWVVLKMIMHEELKDKMNK